MLRGGPVYSHLTHPLQIEGQPRVPRRRLRLDLGGVRLNGSRRPRRRRCRRRRGVPCQVKAPLGGCARRPRTSSGASAALAIIRCPPGRGETRRERGDTVGSRAGLGSPAREAGLANDAGRLPRFITNVVGTAAAMFYQVDRHGPPLPSEGPVLVTANLPPFARAGSQTAA